jgi:hypothetical protein
LIAATPDLADGNIDAAKLAWIGRASFLVEALCAPRDVAAFNLAAEHLIGVMRHTNAHQMRVILHRALARAEAQAPVAAQGAFIPAGEKFTAFQVIGRILEGATRNILIVDPYLNDVAVREFAPLAPEGISVRLLGSSRQQVVATLPTALTRWQQQFGAARPLEIRTAPQRDVHDRLIAIDETSVFTLTQSLKDFANRANATAVREAEHIAEPKIEAYAEIWNNATPIA